MELIDKGLYNRGDNEIRNIPEERAMRYMAVCTLMLLDQVDDLGGFQMDVGPRVHNLEQVTSSLMGRQDKLNDKVNILSFDWNLNLKYQAQVVDFEAKMLLFSLNELVLLQRIELSQTSWSRISLDSIKIGLRRQKRLSGH